MFVSTIQRTRTPDSLWKAALWFGLALSTAVPAAAQTGSGTTLGAWTVAASRDGHDCFATRHFDGPGETTLMLGLEPDGANRLTVLNDNWSIAARQSLSLEFRLSRGGYGDHPAIGIEADGKRGFVATFDARFPDHFAASQRLDIARDKTPVARLDLAGSGAAVAKLKRCAARQAAGVTDLKTPSDIPLDPFAATPPRKRKR